MIAKNKSIRMFHRDVVFREIADKEIAEYKKESELLKVSFKEIADANSKEEVDEAVAKYRRESELLKVSFVLVDKLLQVINDFHGVEKISEATSIASVKYLLELLEESSREESLKKE